MAQIISEIRVDEGAQYIQNNTYILMCTDQRSIKATKEEATY